MIGGYESLFMHICKTETKMKTRAVNRSWAALSNPYADKNGSGIEKV